MKHAVEPFAVVVRVVTVVMMVAMASVVVILVIMVLIAVLVVRFELGHPDLSEVEGLDQETPEIKIERIIDVFTHHRSDGAILGKKLRARVRTGLSTVSILANVTNSQESEDALVPPTINMNISEFETSARIGLIAADNTWRQETRSGSDVSKNNVVHVNVRLSFATTERVEHATGTSATRLFLLLRTNVNIPPDREVNGHVLVEDVLDLTRTGSRVSLDVDRFDGIMEINISEGNIADAGIV